MSVLYTAQTHTTGGRQGESYSADGNLDIQLTPLRGQRHRHQPRAVVRRRLVRLLHQRIGRGRAAQKVKLPADTAVDAEVDLLNTDGAFSLQARLNVSVPGVDREIAQKIVDGAHQTCPYSKATCGNIPVTVTWSDRARPTPTAGY